MFKAKQGSDLIRAWTRRIWTGCEFYPVFADGLTGFYGLAIQDSISNIPYKKSWIH